MFIYYKYLGGLNINDDGKFTSIASDILKQLATKVIPYNIKPLQILNIKLNLNLNKTNIDNGR